MNAKFLFSPSGDSCLTPSMWDSCEMRQGSLGRGMQMTAADDGVAGLNANDLRRPCDAGIFLFLSRSSLASSFSNFSRPSSSSSPSPLNLLLLTPVTGHIKSLLCQHQGADMRAEGYMKNVLFSLSCCYLVIVKRRARQGNERGAKSEREELSPGIKISELGFFRPLPLPHSNCS